MQAALQLLLANSLRHIVLVVSDAASHRLHFAYEIGRTT
ncbi:hypothetical protein V1282_000214 [Nitrobacteraceae bacterium AZCC 2146]